VIQLGLPPYRIDLMTSVSGLDFAQGWSGRVAGTLFEVPVVFLGSVGVGVRQPSAASHQP
jgi:hypothetical protein